MAHGSGAPPPGERLRTLRGLSAYACGHSGSCCRAGWPIPIEPAPLRLIQAAASARELPSTEVPWFNDGILGHSADLNCAFFASPSTGPGCRLEHTLGAEALPVSCRQFPRLLLHDARGWHLSLSAWCGTAAALIVEPTVEASPSADGDLSFLSIDHIYADARVHIEALDAHDAWPPLLRPGVMAGHDAYERWEARLIDECLRPVVEGRASVGSALATALCWSDGLREWRPSNGCLYVLTGKPMVARSNQWLKLRQQPEITLEHLLHTLMDAVPREWKVPAWPAGLTDAELGGAAVAKGAAEAALARYIASRLVASWVAYQGQGLRSVMASLVSAHALAVLALRRNGTGAPTFGRLTSALRAADWLLLHLLDRDQWAAWCSGWETATDASELVATVATAQHLMDSLPWQSESASQL